MSVVAISRGTYSGGKQLAEYVAERLGYRCLSREELLPSAAAQFGVEESILSSALENKPGILEGRSLPRIHYVAFLRSAVCTEFQKDNLVYHGYVGHAILGGISHVLRVRVIADMPFRIKVAMERHRVDKAKAIQLIEKFDKDRAKWVKTIYKMDWQDPSLYDLVMNLEHMSVSAAGELLVSAAEKVVQTTPESQKVMNDLALAAHVRAKIAAHDKIDMHGGIKDYRVEVTALGGTVTISGNANSLNEINRIMQVTRDVPGVREVQSHMRTRTGKRYDFP